VKKFLHEFQSGSRCTSGKATDAPCKKGTLPSLTFYDPQRSVAGNAQQLTSQTGSRIKYLMPTDNIIVLLWHCNMSKKLISLAEIYLYALFIIRRSLRFCDTLYDRQHFYFTAIITDTIGLHTIWNNPVKCGKDATSVKNYTTCLANIIIRSRIRDSCDHSDNEKWYKYVCITTNQPDTIANPNTNHNSNPTTKPGAREGQVRGLADPSKIWSNTHDFKGLGKNQCITFIHDKTWFFLPWPLYITE